MKYTPSLLLLSIISLLLLCASCSEDEPTTLPIPGPGSESPNILLIIGDDMGKDAINGYPEGIIKPSTPNIDAIRNNGLTFNNFWVNPSCTPTRATIITGKYGYRTEVKSVGDVLSQSETTLHKYLSDNTNNEYANALIGKWHLSANNVNPETYGIDYFAGIIRGGVDDYYQWDLYENGQSNSNTKYVTEVLTDLSIDWVNQQSRPWFLWLAYNAPHTPFHVPPDNMHQQGALPAFGPGMDATPYFMGAIEAMDFQIGRLLENIPEDELDNTILIFIGDNGTSNQVAQRPFANGTAKGRLNQGGINVPMFISGAGVTRTGREDHLVNGTDLFATISEMAGINIAEYQDSKSFNNLLIDNNSITRSYQYSERVDGTDQLYTISDGTYKLFVNSAVAVEMYNLIGDPYEEDNLLEATLSAAASTAKLDLEWELTRIRN